MDSCRARKLEPGFAQTYSKPRDLRMSTMRSDPGWSAVRTSAVETGAVSAARAAAEGIATCACCALTEDGLTASAAAPAAVPFRKPRRLGFIVFACKYTTWVRRAPAEKPAAGRIARPTK